jgi:hypothetical protein
MSKIRIDGAICAEKYSWEKEFSFTWSRQTDPNYIPRGPSAPARIYIAPYTIEIEVDGEVEAMLHKQGLKALQRQRTLILAENQTRLEEIDAQIASMMAIEHKPEVPA